MSNTHRTLFVMLVAASSAACGDEIQSLPQVSHVRVAPADTLVAPGDSVRVRATALDLAGQPILVPLAWEVDDRAIGIIDSTGLFLAHREGTATVSVIEEGGVRGFARVRVAPIRAIAPNHAAFGGQVTLHGAGFGPTSVVRFGTAEGRVRSVTSDGRTLTAWVPWEADNGPLSVRLADGRTVESPVDFFLTGGADDALEPNGIDSPAQIQVPLVNPYLATRLTSMDTYRLTLLEPTALTVRVIDREVVNDWQRRTVVQLSREGGVREFVGVAPAWAFARDQRQDGLIARTRLGPGNFQIYVFVGPSNIAVDRRYELLVDTVADFVLPPDGAEPDDAPFEAPLIQTPFAGRFTLENPWTTDYYGLDVTRRSRVHVEATVPGSAGVFLIDGEESVTWQLSNGVRSDTFRGVIAPFGLHSFSCTVEPGRYYVGILENSGNAVSYDLSVEVEPTDLTFLNCRTPTLGVPEAEELRARGALN